MTVHAEMKRRIANGLDPITGRPMETVGKITWQNGVLMDEAGSKVDLDADSHWIVIK
jgi:hypothetical protein